MRHFYILFCRQSYASRERRLVWLANTPDKEPIHEFIDGIDKSERPALKAQLHNVLIGQQQDANTLLRLQANILHLIYASTAIDQEQKNSLKSSLTTSQGLLQFALKSGLFTTPEIYNFGQNAGSKNAVSKNRRSTTPTTLNSPRWDAQNGVVRHPNGTTETVDQVRERLALQRAVTKDWEDQERTRGQKDLKTIARFRSYGAGGMGNHMFDMERNSMQYAGVPLGYHGPTGNDVLRTNQILNAAANGATPRTTISGMSTDLNSPIPVTSRNKEGQLVNRSNVRETDKKRNGDSGMHRHKMFVQGTNENGETETFGVGEDWGSERREELAAAQFEKIKSMNPVAWYNHFRTLESTPLKDRKANDAITKAKILEYAPYISKTMLEWLGSKGSLPMDKIVNADGTPNTDVHLEDQTDEYLIDHINSNTGEKEKVSVLPLVTGYAELVKLTKNFDYLNDYVTCKIIHEMVKMIDEKARQKKKQIEAEHKKIDSIVPTLQEWYSDKIENATPGFKYVIGDDSRVFAFNAEKNSLQVYDYGNESWKVATEADLLKAGLDIPDGYNESRVVHPNKSGSPKNPSSMPSPLTSPGFSPARPAPLRILPRSVPVESNGVSGTLSSAHETPEFIATMEGLTSKKEYVENFVAKANIHVWQGMPYPRSKPTFKNGIYTVAPLNMTKDGRELIFASDNAYILRPGRYNLNGLTREEQIEIVTNLNSQNTSEAQRSWLAKQGRIKVYVKTVEPMTPVAPSVAPPRVEPQLPVNPSTSPVTPPAPPVAPPSVEPATPEVKLPVAPPAPIDAPAPIPTSLPVATSSTPSTRPAPTLPTPAPTSSSNFTEPTAAPPKIEASKVVSPPPNLNTTKMTPAPTPPRQAEEWDAVDTLSKAGNNPVEYDEKLQKSIDMFKDNAKWVFFAKSAKEVAIETTMATSSTRVEVATIEYEYLLKEIKEWFPTKLKTLFVARINAIAPRANKTPLNAAQLEELFKGTPPVMDKPRSSLYQNFIDRIDSEEATPDQPKETDKKESMSSSPTPTIMPTQDQEQAPEASNPGKTRKRVIFKE